MKLNSLWSTLINLPKTLYFNFRYLPIGQALKLPVVFISSTNLICMKGTVSFSCKPRMGMVRIGGGNNPLYSQNGFRCVWANFGGDVVFDEKVSFSRGCAIEVGPSAQIKFGKNVSFGALGRIACYKEMIIGENSRFSWEIILTDTDFHQTINIETGAKSEICKSVNIGKNNWVGIRCMIGKGTVTPDFCTVAAYSLLKKKYEVPNYSIIGGIPAKFISEGWYRDLTSHVKLWEQTKLVNQS